MTPALDDHPLLSRLLRKVGASPAAPPSLESWRALLALIGRTYHEGDQDRYTLERSIDISSRELQGLYQDLKRRTDSELEAQRQQIAESYAVLRATLESASEGVLVADSARVVIAVNQRFLEMMQVSGAAAQLRDHRQMIDHVLRHIDDPEGLRAYIDALHASHETIRRELTLRDGRVLDVYSAPVRLPDGSGVGRVTFFRDVTVERLASAELERARAEAEAASHAKSMFLANMSHELRTPLNAVIGLADLLLIESGDPVTRRQREYLEAVAQSGRHLLALVNDVLDLAKIEAGRHDLELEEVGVRDAIEEAMTGLVPLAHRRGVSLSVEVARGVRPVRADRLRLRQILFNLLSNALKFTDRGGQVEIIATEDGADVAIAIADTGVGIADADRARLFQAFEQLQRASGDRPPGTGLGLALTKRLVDLHGGSIGVESELGTGTTFTVRMPVAS